MTGDLIFQMESVSDFSKAISLATSTLDSVSFVHVGIIEIDNTGEINVIEASPSDGVKMTALNDFIKHSPDIGNGKGVVVKRLNIDFSPTKVIENAKKHIGEPYDWWYMPDNGKMYCSELIYDSFISDNQEPIFETHPMNFLAPDGTMPEFWTKLFNRLGSEIPQGVLGSNPNDLFRDKRLIEILRYF